MDRFPLRAPQIRRLKDGYVLKQMNADGQVQEIVITDEHLPRVQSQLDFPKQTRVIDDANAEKLAIVEYIDKHAVGYHGLGWTQARLALTQLAESIERNYHHDGDPKVQLN